LVLLSRSLVTWVVDVGLLTPRRDTASELSFLPIGLRILVDALGTLLLSNSLKLLLLLLRKLQFRVS
jgi:hypothetical protein